MESPLTGTSRPPGYSGPDDEAGSTGGESVDQPVRRHEGDGGEEAGEAEQEGEEEEEHGGVDGDDWSPANAEEVRVGTLSLDAVQYSKPRPHPYPASRTPTSEALQRALALVRPHTLPAHAQVYRINTAHRFGSWPSTYRPRF